MFSRMGNWLKKIGVNKEEVKMEFLLNYSIWVVAILFTIAALLGLFLAGCVLIEIFKLKSGK